MELRRRAIKRWVPCGGMDRRLKIPHAAKVVCGFRKPSEECLSLAPLLIGFDWPSSYNTIQYNIKEDHHLHKLQKKAVRIITQSDYIAHTDPLWKQNRLIKLPIMCSLAV